MKQLHSSNFRLQPGLLAFYGAGIQAAAHCHHAIQIVLPVGQSTCLVAKKAHRGAVVIGSQVPHSLTLSEGWLLLVDPGSLPGMTLEDWLGGSDVLAIYGDPSGATSNLNRSLSNPGNSLEEFCRIYGFSHLSDVLNAGALPTSQIDPRIQQLLRILDRCLLGECLKPAQWRASEVARTLNLSESRFLHLVKEQVGLPWRAYLRWRRVICALYALQQGKDATTAAHLAGFSDSAHLSRTFRAHFGMSIRQAKMILV